MKLYMGHLTYHGLDVLLTVHDDGTHEIATRPGLRDTWTTWSAPTALVAESGEVSS